jgi:hypothetical protein
MKERVPDGKGRLKSELRSGQKFLIRNSSVDLTKYFFHLRFTVSTWYHLTVFLIAPAISGMLLLFFPNAESPCSETSEAALSGTAGTAGTVDPSPLNIFRSLSSVAL